MYTKRPVRDYVRGAVDTINHIHKTQPAVIQSIFRYHDHVILTSNDFE
jgi:hypothetical protein